MPWMRYDAMQASRRTARPSSTGLPRGTSPQPSGGPPALGGPRSPPTACCRRGPRPTLPEVAAAYVPTRLGGPRHARGLAGRGQHRTLAAPSYHLQDGGGAVRMDKGECGKAAGRCLWPCKACYAWFLHGSSGWAPAHMYVYVCTGCAACGCACTPHRATRRRQKAA